MMSKQIFMTVFARIITLISGFIASILTARYLGAQGRGDYFFIATTAALITQFAQLGLASSNTYFVAKQPQLLGRLIANSVWISLVVGTLSATIVWGVMMALYTQLFDGALILLLLVPSSILYLLGTNLLIGINQISAFNWFQIGSNVLIAGLMVVSGLMSFHAYGFLLLNASGWIAVVLILLLTLNYYTKTKINYFQFNMPSFIQAIPYGAKAYFITLLGFLILKGNVFILRYFCSDSILGYYSIAAQLNDCLIIIPTSFALVLFPHLVRTEQSRWDEMMKPLLLIAVLMLFGCILAALLVKPFIQLMFGSQFLPAVSIFWWMLPGAFFLSLITIISSYLAALAFPKELLFIWCLVFVISLLTSWLLIPQYAGSGAAMSLSISYIILFGMIYRLAQSQKRSFHCEPITH